VGLWIVLFESIGRSGLLALLGLVPMLGLVVVIWTALEVPAKHGRSRWWTLPLIVPVANIVGYWVYAFTFGRDTEPQLSPA
jgi:hypothetical protein